MKAKAERLQVFCSSDFKGIWIMEVGDTRPAGVFNMHGPFLYAQRPMPYPPQQGWSRGHSQKAAEWLRVWGPALMYSALTEI